MVSEKSAKVLIGGKVYTLSGYEEEEYLQKLIDDAQWEINYHMEERDKAIDRKMENLKFYSEFKEELNKLK